MKFNPINRRMFLIGGGGSFLSIPLLTSLLPRRVEAQVLANQPLRFILVGSGYSPGEKQYFGTIDKNSLTKQAGNELIDQVGVKSLKGMKNFSYILDPFFSAGLQDKISILRSLDIMAKINKAHPQAGPACAAFDAESERHSNGYQESVDMLIAKSIKGVPELTKHVAITPQFPDLDSKGNPKSSKVYSFRYNSATKTYEQMDGISDPNFLLAKLGVGGTTPTQPTTTGISRRDILSQVLEDYKSLKSSGRLSSEDSRRLDHYLSIVSEIQTGMAEESMGAPSSCQKPTLLAEKAYPKPPSIPPSYQVEGNYLTNPQILAQVNQMVSDWQVKAREAQDIRITNQIRILKAAMMCDVTRVASLAFRYDGQGDMDHAFHHATGSLTQTEESVFAKSFYSNQRRIASATAQLMKAMDEVQEGGNGTMLDNSIVYWAQQFCCSTNADFAHSKHNMPVIVGGSAGGQLNTGYFVDYRTSDMTDGKYNPRGVPFNNLLVTFMNCFGIGSSQYENQASRKGYGDYGGLGAKADAARFNTTAARRAALPFLYKGKKLG